MTLIYCSRCDDRTETINFKTDDIEVKRTKKSGDVSITQRKVMKGICDKCNKKKSVLANSEGTTKNDKPLKGRKNKIAESMQNKVLDPESIQNKVLDLVSIAE